MIITIILVLLIMSMFAWGPAYAPTYLGPRNVLVLLVVVLVVAWLLGGLGRRPF